MVKERNSWLETRSTRYFLERIVIGLALCWSKSIETIALPVRINGIAFGNESCLQWENRIVNQSEIECKQILAHLDWVLWLFEWWLTLRLQAILYHSSLLYKNETMVCNCSFGEPLHYSQNSQNDVTPILQKSIKINDVSETNQLLVNTLYFWINEGPHFAFRFSIYTSVL